MDELILIIPTLEHKKDAMEMRKEWLDFEGKNIHGSVGFHHYDNYEDWLDNVEKSRNNQNIRLKVPASQYFGVYNNRIVGTINIRHYLNDELLKHGGHIGYGVRPSERRKGYAAKMLALALEECRRLGIVRVLITCDKDNIGSARTIQKNGGILENEITDDNGEVIQRYWIDI